MKGVVINTLDSKLNSYSFEQTKERVDNVEQDLIEKPIFGLSYPWIAYSRFYDLIVTNLADISNSQKIIKLPKNLRLQNIAGCNFSDRIVIVTWNLDSTCYDFHEILMPKPFE